MKVTLEELMKAIEELEKSSRKSAQVAIIYLKRELKRREKSGRPAISNLTRKEQIAEAVKRFRLKKIKKRIKLNSTNENMKMNLRKTKFTIETFPGLIFEGYTQGDNWNGWAVPYFTFDEAREVAKIHEDKLTLPAHYDESGDKFIFETPDETKEYVGVVIEDKKLYPIGSFEWIWEESEPSFSSIIEM